MHVVTAPARTEALQDGLLGPAREILREIQLAPVPDTDVQEGVTYEVYGGALEGVGESRGSDQQKRARPPEPGVDQPVDQVEVEVHEPEVVADAVQRAATEWNDRSEEHTSELQSQSNLVCRLLLEKK